MPITSDLIDTAMEEQQNQTPRDYLGPSGWKDCDRAMWFGYRGISGAILHKAQTLRIFNIGHMLEEGMVKWLEAAGIEIFMREATIKTKWGTTFGHIDGIAKYQGKFYLLEMKTAKASKFKEMVKNGIPDYYYAQIQIYMHNSGQLSDHGNVLSETLYVITNKDTAELDIKIIPADPVYGELQTDRMHDIIVSDALPAANKSYKCSFCDHKAVCEGDKPAAISCKTCANASAIEGRFECSLGHELETCGDHVYHPQLMELMGYVVEDVDGVNLCVDYGKFAMAPQGFHKEGKPTFTSAEFIDALKHNFLEDEFGMMMKEEFCGRVTFDDGTKQGVPF